MRTACGSAIKFVTLRMIALPMGSSGDCITFKQQVPNEVGRQQTWMQLGPACTAPRLHQPSSAAVLCYNRVL
jgi:hypothetical protein